MHTDTDSRSRPQPRRPRAALHRRALALALCLGVVPLCPGADAPLALKLDYRLGAQVGGGGEGLSVPVLFGVHDLRDRIGRVNDGISSMAAENRRRAEELTRLESLIDRLRRLAAVQDGAIAALERGIDAASAPPPRAAALPPAAAPPPASVSSPAAVRPSPAPTSAPAPSARAASLPIALWDDLSLDRVAIDAALAVVAALLLGCLLFLHARRRSRAGSDRPAIAAAPSAPRRAAAERAPAPPSAGIEVRESRAAKKRSLPPAAADALAAATAPPPDAPPPEASPLEQGTVKLHPALVGAGDRPGPEVARFEASELHDAAAEPEIDLTGRMGRPKKTDPDALREVDTLIAFEDHERAIELLEELLRQNPENPEYRVRLLHLERARGNVERSDEEEELLMAMMDGPLSETILRVKEIGRGLLPGHPLFDDKVFTRRERPTGTSGTDPGDPDQVVRQVR